MRPFFHPTHISPDLFTPLINRFLANLPPLGEPFDIQSRLGQLSLEMSIVWLTGKDIGKDTSSRATNECLGKALVEAQRVVGRRVKIGTVWVRRTVIY